MLPVEYDERVGEDYVFFFLQYSEPTLSGCSKVRNYLHNISYWCSWCLASVSSTHSVTTSDVLRVK